MNKNDWAGIYPAMLTPLKEDESLDEETTVRFVDQLIEQGADGLYLSGNSGEGYALNEETWARVFPVVAGAAKGRCKLIAHVGGVPTRQALRLTETACEAGVDAVSAMTPYGGTYSVEEILAYYRDLAAASSRPMFAYHIPCKSGYDLALPDLYRMLEIPNVEGMKFTNEDCFKLERLVSRFPEKVFFMGCDQMLLQGLAAGAVGGIGTTYNLLLPEARAVFQGVQAGDYDGALQAQARINSFVEAYMATGVGLRGIKALAGEVYDWPQVFSPAPGKIPVNGSVAPLRAALEEVEVFG